MKKNIYLHGTCNTIFDVTEYFYSNDRGIERKTDNHPVVK